MNIVSHAFARTGRCYKCFKPHRPHRCHSRQCRRRPRVACSAGSPGWGLHCSCVCTTDTAFCLRGAVHVHVPRQREELAACVGTGVTACRGCQRGVCCAQTRGMAMHVSLGIAVVSVVARPLGHCLTTCSVIAGGVVTKCCDVVSA